MAQVFYAYEPGAEEPDRQDEADPGKGADREQKASAY